MGVKQKKNSNLHKLGMVKEKNALFWSYDRPDSYEDRVIRCFCTVETSFVQR